MNVILLILATIILLVLYRRENFKSVNSDFIDATGQKGYETHNLRKLVAKYQKQIDDIPQTRHHIPNTKGYTSSIGWDPLFVPEGKTRNDVLDNLGNIDSKSFIKILGWNPFYEPTEGEVDIIQAFLKTLVPNVVSLQDGVLIQKLTKHEDNFFTMLFYLSDEEFNMYYARVNALLQVQNGTVIVQKLKFEGLVTPFSIVSVESAENDEYIRKGYNEREQHEQKFLTHEEIKSNLKEFDKHKYDILTRGRPRTTVAPGLFRLFF